MLAGFHKTRQETAAKGKDGISDSDTLWSILINHFIIILVCVCRCIHATDKLIRLIGSVLAA